MILQRKKIEVIPPINRTNNAMWKKVNGCYVIFLRERKRETKPSRIKLATNVNVFRRLFNSS